MRRLVTTTADEAVKKKERPGLLEYLEERLGRSSGNGEERSFHCHKCIEILGDESSSKKLGINLRKGMAKCFRCGYKAHDLERLFRDMNKGALRLVEAQIIAGEAKLPKETLTEYMNNWIQGDKETTAKALRNQILPRETVSILDPKAKVGYRYMVEKRGIDPDLLVKYELGYAPDGDYGNRVIFPVIQNGAQVYFTTRYCGDHVMKAKNPPNIDGYLKKTDVLWNYDGVRGKAIVTVCEGAISGMAFSDSVALLGKEISETQLAMITDLVPYGLEELIIALDADAGKYSERIYERVSSRVPACSILYFDHGDPDERREDLPRLLEARKAPDLMSRVRSRMFRRA